MGEGAHEGRRRRVAEEVEANEDKVEVQAEGSFVQL